MDARTMRICMFQITLYNGHGEDHEGEGLFEKAVPTNIPNSIREVKPQIQKAEGMRTG